MSNTVALSGNDSLVMNNRVFADFADGDPFKLTFPNNIANVKTGKNGNSLYALNESGRQADGELRLVKGSPDDKYMNNLLNQQQLNFAGTVLSQGEFVKKIGDGTGKITSDTYIISGGLIVNQVDAKMNVEGDVDQSVSIYKLKFTNAPRVMT